ncbi:hypothetical protein Drorol1_Dr00005907 [Drosera rotundifolia]
MKIILSDILESQIMAIAACAAVRNVRGLPLPEDLTKHSNSLDIFQWLQLRFGFQTGNVANQREHLILLLANTHIRQGQKHVSQLQLSDEAVDGLMRKFFRNYTDWCKFLARKSNIRLPYVKQEAQQYKLLYIGLYLLTWGEAANLRFMPECLCFIYHHEEEIPNNWLSKTNFVEIRSFWQIFRSFDRMWSFLILALQLSLTLPCPGKLGIQ